MKAKKYANGGKTPASGPFKKPEWVGKGLEPKQTGAKGEMTPAEYLERLTWQKTVDALGGRGVSMIDKSDTSKKILGQGNTNSPNNNYELAIKKAKEYGVYDQARQDAVKEFRAWQASQRAK
jgi:hypothetical protein